MGLVRTSDGREVVPDPPNPGAVERDSRTVL